ncbi:MAG: hypothetical protein MI725_16575 [Pirellulales bacterium]|nr:hypothetical protein [Pirellulales bacterium]
MSERERWIVYPLLFFALGAALRDKLTQSVESKDIVCRSLKIVDQHNSNRILAELGAKRTGMLDGDVPVSYLRADNLICQGLSVVDQQHPDKALVYLGTGQSPNYQPGELPRRVGALVLQDNSGSYMSELRADQFLGTRMICNQVFVRDPENRRPLVYIGTEAMPGISFNEEDPAVSHQGVIILNNQHLGIRLSPPVSSQPKSEP